MLRPYGAPILNILKKDTVLYSDLIVKRKIYIEERMKTDRLLLLSNIWCILY